MTTATYTGGANSDSGYVRTAPSTHYTNSALTLVEYDGLGAYYHTRTRLANLTIPRYSTILSATLYHYVEYYDGDVTSNVYLESADNPAATTTYADFTGRSLYAAQAWVVSTAIGWKSVDVTARIQTLVNRSGWTSGNACQFFLYYGLGSGALPYRSFTGYAGGANKPYMDVEYDAPLTNLGKVYVVGL